MNTHTIRQELIEYIDDNINEDSPRDLSELHHELFNTDYYIVGYYQAEQWLKEHNISAFEAIRFCQDYENDNFGECRQYENAEQVVNMLTYIIGEELVYNRYDKSKVFGYGE